MTKVSSIYLSQSLSGLGTVLMVLDPNSAMNSLATMELMRNPGCAMDLIIILTLEEEVGIFSQNSSNAVMCHMDKEVLLCNCGSCCSFCVMMGMASTDVKRPHHIIQ